MLTISPIADSFPPVDVGGIGRGCRQAAGGTGLPGRGDTVSLRAGDGAEEISGYTRRSILRQGPDDGMTPEEKEMVKELQARDREVRLHEQAHVALLGPYAVGGPSYTYQMGPDGRMYAVGGSVAADTGAEATPEATAQKARMLRLAAGGGGDPSAADMSVAAMAGVMERAAQGRIA